MRKAVVILLACIVLSSGVTACTGNSNNDVVQTQVSNYEEAVQNSALHLLDKIYGGQTAWENLGSLLECVIEESDNYGRELVKFTFDNPNSSFNAYFWAIVWNIDEKSQTYSNNGMTGVKTSLAAAGTVTIETFKQRNNWNQPLD